MSASLIISPDLSAPSVSASGALKSQLQNSHGLNKSGEVMTKSLMADPLRQYYLQEMGIEPMMLRQVNLKKNKLASLGVIVSHCTHCPLHLNRQQTVFSRGSADAKLMIIGDAPGIDPALQGLPFMGKAGALLAQMLSTIDCSGDEVYMTNIVKCKPIQQLNPHDEPVHQCADYLSQQIALVAPQLILALGALAGQSLLNSTEPLSTLRNKIHDCQGIPLLVSHHPDELLLYPLKKRDAFRDLLMVKQCLIDGV